MDGAVDPDAGSGVLGAVVVAGGGAARMGGADKASIELGGRTLLERVLAALPREADVVVVGDEVRTSRPVTFTREDPPGGGPAAGLLAGLRAFPHAPDRVVVLAGDLPLVTGDTVDRHATIRGLANALIEIRQDLIASDEGAEEWAERFARLLEPLAGRPELRAPKIFGTRRRDRLRQHGG